MKYRNQNQKKKILGIDFLMNKIMLYNDDCFNVLKTLPDNSVDLVLTDPPYGTTAI